jgi:hypothetical protein
MPVTDALAYVHGTGASAFGPLTNTAGVYGDAFGAAGSQYSNLELDFGAPNTAANYPYLPQFPSLSEKGYTSPPEVVGDGGVEQGLHIVIGSAFNTLTSINFEVCTSATTGALYSSSPNPIAARTLTVAQMAVLGAHYFIPVNWASVLEFLRFYGAVSGSNPTTGTLLAWFGPKTGGEQ